jgi:preprotein translocase subunit YajC
LDFDFGMAQRGLKSALLLAACARPRKRTGRKAPKIAGFTGSGSVAIGRAAVIVRAKFKCDCRVGGQRPAHTENHARETSMFSSPAFAQGLFGGGAGGDGGMLMSLLPFILIFVIMYFLILRPQQKRAKQHQEMVKNVRRGDTVVTNGGLIGKVTKVIDDDQIEIEIADDVRIRQLRAMLTDVRAKGEPVKDEAAAG